MSRSRHNHRKYRELWSKRASIANVSGASNNRYWRRTTNRILRHIERILLNNIKRLFPGNGNGRGDIDID